MWWSKPKLGFRFAASVRQRTRWRQHSTADGRQQTGHGHHIQLLSSFYAHFYAPTLNMRAWLCTVASLPRGRLSSSRASSLLRRMMSWGLRRLPALHRFTKCSTEQLADAPVHTPVFPKVKKKKKSRTMLLNSSILTYKNFKLFFKRFSYLMSQTNTKITALGINEKLAGAQILHTYS